MHQALVVAFACLCLVLGPRHASAAPAYDGDVATVYSGNPGGLNPSAPFTVAAGTNKLLVVMVLFDQSGNPATASVTYNGVSMTQLRRDNSSCCFGAFIFYLPAPATGSNTMVITPGSAWNNGMVVKALSFSGVNQTTPFGAQAAASTGWVNPLVASTSFTPTSTNSLVVHSDWFISTGTTLTVSHGSAISQTNHSPSQPFTNGIGTWAPSATSAVTLQHSWGSSSGGAQGLIQAFELMPAGAAPTNTPTSTPTPTVGMVTSACALTLFSGNGTAGTSGDLGAATAAAENAPRGVAVDSLGNVYVADTAGNVVRKITPGGIISTYAGTGSAGFSGDGGAATSAQLNAPMDLAVDPSGNLYISGNNVIRKVTSAGIISTIAGTSGSGLSNTNDGGLATGALIGSPDGLAIDPTGTMLYLTANTTFTSRIRGINLLTGIINTYAGNANQGYTLDNIPATASYLNRPADMAFDSLGNMYIADYANNRIRKVDMATGFISTVAGNGSNGNSGDGGLATAASIRSPSGIAVDPYGNLFISFEANNTIRRVDSVTGIISTFSGAEGTTTWAPGTASSATFDSPYHLSFDAWGNLYIAMRDNNRVAKVSPCNAAPAATATPTFTATPTRTWTPSPTQTPADCPISDPLNDASLASFWNTAMVRGRAGISSGVLQLTTSHGASPASPNGFKGYALLQPTSGDFDVQVMVTSTVATYGVGGLIVTNDPYNPSANRLSLTMNGTSALATSGSVTLTTQLSLGVPAYLRLIKSGSSFLYFTSTNNINWTYLTGTALTLTGNYYVGLFSGSTYSVPGASMAAFDNFQVNSGNGAPGLRSDSFGGTLDKWPIQMGLNGSQAEGSSLVMSPYDGPGPGGAANDVMRYAYQTTCASSLTVTVRIPDIGWSGSVGAAGGIMLRSSLDSGAPEVSYGLSNYTGTGYLTTRLNYRGVQDGGTTSWSGPNFLTNTARYVRLEKTGNDFRAYYSSDGSSWTYVTGTTVALGTCYQIGMSGYYDWNPVDNPAPGLTVSFNDFNVVCATNSPTPTATPTPTPTWTPTATATPTATPTWTPSPTSGATPIGIPMTKSINVASASIGDTITFSITWQNNTGAPTNISIWDTLAVPLTYIGADNGGTYQPRLVLWNLGTQANGAFGVVKVWAVVSGYP